MREEWPSCGSVARIIHERDTARFGMVLQIEQNSQPVFDGDHRAWGDRTVSAE